MKAKVALALALLASAPQAWASVPAAGPFIGTWINPRRSVEVETRMCGERLCGRVSWASPKALADAADAGIRSLIGIELLQDYAPSVSGAWHGRVYVPDMGRRFQSTIAIEGPEGLRVSGCILGGLLCKSQLWHRV